MKTIEVDDDIYSFLLSRTVQIGESASAILRRELRLEEKRGVEGKQAGRVTHELTGFLQGVEVKFGSATDKFLAVLAEGYRRKPKEFEKLVSLRGRDRVYFAKSREEISRSGKSTQPLQVPGSPFWVMTNSPTPQKRTMLRQALQVLGFSDGAAIEASNSL